jgi:hypothetical protein
MATRIRVMVEHSHFLGRLVRWIPPRGGGAPEYGTVTGVTETQVLVLFGRDDVPRPCYPIDLTIVDN